MDILDVTFYVLIAVQFMLGVLAFSAVGQSQRQKMLIGWFVSILVLSGVRFTALAEDKYSVSSFFYVYTAVVWSPIIGQLVARKRLASPIVKVRPRMSLWGIGLVLVAGVWFVFQTLLFLTPNMRSAIDGRPIFDTQYFQSRIPFLIFSISLIVMFVSSATQKTVFHQDGVLHGVLWAWSDFRGYSWRVDDPTKLHLNIKPLLGFPRTIILKMSVNERQQIEDLLQQKILSSQV